MARAPDERRYTLIAVRTRLRCAARITLLASGLASGACAAHDPQRHLATELAFLQVGVQLDEEEREVRRVLSQRGMRVVARVAGPSYVALGAATRDGAQSAVRVVSQRGVAYADDAARQDLFRPSTLALLEHFGGSIGEYVLVASARIPSGRDLGCVSLLRVLPDGRVVECTLDVSTFGSRACVANLAPGAAGHVRATIGFPDLHAVGTPVLEVELAFNEAPVGRRTPLIPVLKVSPGDWVERERLRLSTTRLARAPFSVRHATGVARAALASFAGKERAEQVAVYREAVQQVLPGSAEAEIFSDTLAHIGRGWTDPTAGEAQASEKGEGSGSGQLGPDAPAADPHAVEEALQLEDATIIEPELTSP